MPQRNNHARSRQKRKKLRLKNFWKKVYEKRASKTLTKPKRKPITGIAKEQALHLSSLYPTGFSYNWNTGNRRDKSLNQRQKRKIARQQPHGKTFK